MPLLLLPSYCQQRDERPDAYSSNHYSTYVERRAYNTWYIRLGPGIYQVTSDHTTINIINTYLVLMYSSTTSKIGTGK